MLKYRSLKFFSDAWLMLLTAICHAADAIHAAEQKALTYSNKLDEKAIDLAHEARDLLIQKETQALALAGEARDKLHERADRLVKAAAALKAEAEAQFESDIDKFGAGVDKAHAFLDDAITYHQ
jgi:ribonuclease HI